MARRQDWTPLCAGDPTPGEVGDVEQAAATFTAAASGTDVLAGQVESFGYATIGGAGWDGAAFEGFEAAFALLPPITRLGAERMAQVAAALRSWGEELAALQSTAEALWVRAVDVDAALSGAQHDHTRAVGRLQTARARLAAIPPGEPGRGAAEADVRAAVAEVMRLDARVDQLTAELAALRVDADGLAGDHEAGAAATAGRVGGLESAEVALLPFSGRAAQAVVSAVVPGFELDEDGDGIVSPAEIAGALAQIAYRDDVRDLERRHALDGLAPVLAQVAADPDRAAELLEAAGGPEAFVDAVEEILAATPAQLPDLPPGGRPVLAPVDGYVQGGLGGPADAALGLRTEYWPEGDGTSLAELADIAGNVAEVAGYIGVAAAAIVVVVGSGGAVVVPATATTSAVTVGTLSAGAGTAAAATGTVASGVQLGAGIVLDDDEHISSGAVGVALGGTGIVTSGAIDAVDDLSEQAVRILGVRDGLQNGTGLVVGAAISEDDDG